MTIACACEHCGHEFDAAPVDGHRLLYGDSANSTDVDRLLDGQRAELCLTDPPYGLGGSATGKNKYVEHEDTLENLVALIADFLPLAQAHADRTVLTPGNLNHRLYPAPTWTMAWFVPAGTGCGPWGFCCWQPILCYGKDPKLAKGKGSHPDAIVHTEAAEKLGHPSIWSASFTDAPLFIFVNFDADSARSSCRAIDITPAYVDIGVRRWSDFTGREAVLADDGRTFDEVAAARGVSP